MNLSSGSKFKRKSPANCKNQQGSEYIGELTNGAGKYFMDAGNILFHMTGQVIDD